MKKRGIIWSAAPLRGKVACWFAAIMTVMVLTLVALFVIGRTTFSAYSRVQESHVVCYVMQEALETENRAFETCLREPSGENRQVYQDACAATRAAMDALPFDYNEIGRDRYARTWNVLHGYAGYCTFRDAVMAADPAEPGYVEQMYQVKEMQEYLEEYALLLVQATIEQNSQTYRLHAVVDRFLPWVCLLVLAMAAGCLYLLVRQFSGEVIRPVLEISEASRVLAENDFSGDDIPVRSGDELGKLAQAFNRMKHALAGHIATLEEKNRMEQQLHSEALARLELKRNLDHTQLEMLRSQIEPHFLFNTLNMISCMARLEEAATTDRMILSLSNLFRYNLRTRSQVVCLEEELQVLEDYLYLQRMRFDGRMTCSTILRVDPAQVRLPSFTLQPVVENAFHHGLKYVEEGGRVTLRIWQEAGSLIVSIADNGRGMTPEELAALSEKIENSEETGRGIGLGNICRRIRMLYPENGGFRIYSRAGKGTVVQLVIPQQPDDHL